MMAATRTTGSGQGADKRRRSAARLACVQALYEMEVSGAATDPVLEAFMSERWSVPEAGFVNQAPDPAFLTSLVRGVSAGRADLDALISPLLPEHRDLDRMEILLRVMLRAGAYELAFRPDIPAKVAINEYVDVAHAFYAGKEPGLVNAVLDRLARQVRGEDVGSGEH